MTDEECDWSLEGRVATRLSRRPGPETCREAISGFWQADLCNSNLFSVAFLADQLQALASGHADGEEVANGGVAEADAEHASKRPRGAGA